MFIDIPLADLKNMYESNSEEQMKKLGCFEACVFQKLHFVRILRHVLLNPFSFLIFEYVEYFYRYGKNLSNYYLSLENLETN